MRLPVAVAVLLVLAPCGMPLGAHPQGSSGTAPAARAANPPGPAKPSKGRPSSLPKRPRYLVPGVGGAVPAVRPPSPGAGIQGIWPGRAPAGVGLPGVPGPSGLLARSANPLATGVTAFWGADESPVGWERDGGSRARLILQRLREAGALATRVLVRQSDIERTPGRPEWGETDRLVRLLSQGGITVLCRVVNDPARSRTDLEKFGSALAARYRGAVRYFEFREHPDAPGSSARAYAADLAAFARGVRRGNPAALVAVGSLEVRSAAFLEALYKAGAQASFDAVALDLRSPAGSLPFAWMDGIRDLMVARGDAIKPVWAADWGWTRSAGAPIDAAAPFDRWITEAMAGLMARPWVHIASYWALQAPAGDLPAPLAPLCAPSLQPTPAIAAFARAARGGGEPAVAVARVSWTGALPRSGFPEVRTETVRGRLDAAKASGAIRPVIAGLSLAQAAGTVAASSVGIAARAMRARLVRFDPIAIARSRSAATTDAEWRGLDTLVAAIREAGATPLLSFGTLPEGLAAAPGSPRMPADAGKWAELVRAIVRRCSASREHALYCELPVGEGPTALSAREWSLLAPVFARAVAEAAPQARVGGPLLPTYDRARLAAAAASLRGAGVQSGFLSWSAVGESAPICAGQVVEMAALSVEREGGNPWETIVDWAPRSSGVAAEASDVSAIATLSQLLSDREGATVLWSASGWSEGVPPLSVELFASLRGRSSRIETEDALVRGVAAVERQRVSAMLWCAPRGGSSQSSGAGQDVAFALTVTGLPWSGPTLFTARWLDGQGAMAHSRPPGALSSVAAVTGTAEVVVVLPAGGAALVEAQPAPVTPIHVSVRTPAYVALSGCEVAVTATLSNRSSERQVVRCELLDASSPDSAILAQRRVVLGAGSTEAVRFQAPAGGPGLRRLRVRAGLSEGGALVRVVPAVIVSVEGGRAGRTAAAPSSGEPAPGTVLIALRSRASRPVRVVVKGAGPPSGATVPPMGVARLSVNLAGVARMPGLHTSEVLVTADGGATERVVVTVNVPATCKRTARRPRIDGDLAEWMEASRLDPADPGRVGVAATASGAQVMALWDAQFLYIAASVPDDLVHQPYRPDAMRLGDCLVVSVGQKNERIDLGMAPGPTRSQVYRLATKGSASAVPGATAAVVAGGGRIVYEAAVPWSAIVRSAPSPGSRLPFGVAVYRSNGGLPQLLWWGEGDGPESGTLRVLQLAP